jgi:hypothetical protein
VQVPYAEGVAIRIGPEPCADAREGAGEAQCQRGRWHGFLAEHPGEHLDAELGVPPGQRPQIGSSTKHPAPPRRGSAL